MDFRNRGDSFQSTSASDSPNVPEGTKSPSSQHLPKEDAPEPSSPLQNSVAAFSQQDTIVVAVGGDEDVIQYASPRRRSGLRTPKANRSLKALENVSDLLDRESLLAYAINLFARC
jgi:hypothetical protein